MGLPQLRHHANSIFGPQRNLRLYLDALAGNQLEPPFLRQSDQAENCLHPRKGFANALAIAAAKREIGKAWPPALALRCEAFRIKLQRIREKVCIALNDVLAEENISARRQLVRANLHIARRLPSHRPRWRIDAH